MFVTNTNKIDKVILCAQNISHSFANSKLGRQSVLNNINFEIRENEIISLLGKSGSGKSTFLRILSGLLNPCEGEVFLDSDKVTKPSLKTAMVFQTFALLPWLTVLENVSFGLEAKKLSKKEVEEKARNMISLIGLSNYENSYPKELSGGMRQRVGFARALAVEPEILLMDEPFSSLDIFTAQKLKEDLLKLWQDKRIKTSSMVCVTHNVEEAVMLSDRVCIFDGSTGQICEEFQISESQEHRDVRSKYISSKIDEIIFVLLKIARNERSGNLIYQPFKTF